MNKTQRLKKLSMALLRGILCALILLSFLLTVLSFSAKKAFGEREGYRRVMQDPAISKELLAHVWDELETECLFYGLPTAIIDESLTEQDAADFSLRYIDAVYDAVFVTGKLESPQVDPALFRPAIATRLEAEGIDDATIDNLASEFARVTTSVWKLGLNQQLLSPLHRIFTNVWVKRFVSGGPVLAGVTACLVAVTLLLGMHRIRKQAFTVAGVLTAGSMLLFVPLWLLNRYGLAERLVLGDSPLRSFVVRWMNSVTAQLSTITMIVLIVASVITVLCAVWLVWPKNSKPDDNADEASPSPEESAETAPATEAGSNEPSTSRKEDRYAEAIRQAEDLIL